MYREGMTRLAPFYDLVCTRAYKMLDRNLALRIGNQGYRRFSSGSRRFTGDRNDRRPSAQAGKKNLYLARPLTLTLADCPPLGGDGRPKTAGRPLARCQGTAGQRTRACADRDVRRQRWLPIAFDVRDGTRLSAQTLFSAAGRKALSRLIRQRNERTIRKALRRLRKGRREGNLPTEDRKLARDMYAACLERRQSATSKVWLNGMRIDRWRWSLGGWDFTNARCEDGPSVVP